jgi:hypothetical protein
MCNVVVDWLEVEGYIVDFYYSVFKEFLFQGAGQGWNNQEAKPFRVAVVA